LVIKLQSSQGLNARDRPDERLIGEAGIGVSAADTAMGARQPGLFDMASRLLALPAAALVYNAMADAFLCK